MRKKRTDWHLRTETGGSPALRYGGRTGIGCKGVILGSVIFLLIALAFVADASAATYSRHIKDLSAGVDPEGLYNHANPKIGTSGLYVHVVWLAQRWVDGSSDCILYYARSANGGKTFAKARKLAQGDLGFHAESNNLVVSGPYVHVLYHNKYQNPTGFVHLRSANNGTTFTKRSRSFDGGVAEVHATAQGKSLAFFWAVNSAHAGNIYCVSSEDGGATTKTTVVAHDDDSDGSRVWGYSVVDAVRSGAYVYALSVTTDENWFSSQSHLYLWASVDGGKTFKTPRKVNRKAANGGYYAPVIQDHHYSPNLAASGEEVHVVWINIDDPGSFDGWVACTLRTVASRNAGSSLEAPKTLHKFPSGYQSGSNPGLETILRKGENVYVVHVKSDEPAGTFLWRSNDAGLTWRSGRQLSKGGWWPVIQADPGASGQVHVANSSYFRSRNNGASFDGGVNPHYNFNDWLTSQMAVRHDGIAHYTGSSGSNINAGDHRILYRRLAPEPDPADENKAVRLAQAEEDGHVLSSHLQVAGNPSLNFSEKMTLEFWVKRLSDDAQAYQRLVQKKRTYGEGSYTLGAWDSFQIYGRIVTTGSADQYYGDWLGTGITLPRGEWTHVAMTYDAKLARDNWKIYINGILANKADLTGKLMMETIDAPLLMGYDGPYFYGGIVHLDELRLWRVARTKAQIQANMNRRMKGTETGLTAYYSFDGTFKDITNRGNDAVPIYNEAFVLDHP